jgi:hypothetical protein
VKNVVYLPFEAIKEESRRWRVGGKETPMRRIHQVADDREGFMLDLDEIAREGARRMLACALEAEAEAYVEFARAERDGRGHALVARNGYAREREVLCGAGSLTVKTPRVNDRRIGEDGGSFADAGIVFYREPAGGAAGGGAEANHYYIAVFASVTSEADAADAMREMSSGASGSGAFGVRTRPGHCRRGYAEPPKIDTTTMARSPGID